MFSMELFLNCRETFNQERRQRQTDGVRRPSVTLSFSHQSVSVSLFIRVNLKKDDRVSLSPLVRMKKDEEMKRLSGESSSLQLPRLLQLFNPATRNRPVSQCVCV